MKNKVVLKTETYMSEQNLVLPVDTQRFLYDLVDEFQTFPDTDLLSFTNGTNDIPFSMCVELTFFNSTSIQFIISKRLDNALIPSGAEWQVYLTSDERVGIALFDKDHLSAASINISSSTNVALIQNTKYNIVFTYDGSTLASGIKIYVNGVSVGVTGATAGIYTKMPLDAGGASTAADVVIGKALFSSGAKFHGYVHGISIFHEELNQDQVTSLNNRAAPTSVGNCIWYNKQGDKAVWDGTNWNTKDWSRNSNLLTVSSNQEKSDKKDS